jgi:predicted acylesterase/phospholipase RssA
MTASSGPAADPGQAPTSSESPRTPRPRRSLVLAGGGYKVAFQAGVLQVWLDEAGLEFDHADGASGGNLNLAMWCQGMSGQQIADNWRRLRPMDGVAFNWRSWWKLIWADSLLVLDRFRRNLLPRWGLDWTRIRATQREATFNLYDFSTHELVPMPASAMDEDLLMASISIPMWFPPLRRGGHTWLDAVFISDANLEAAIERGADELWVIWTVSERSEWWAGFVGIYFGIIEIVANGNLRRVLRRIERNNAAIEAGGTGEFGRHIEVRMLRAEVPVHYLAVLSNSRVRECVERGVAAARRWCAEQGILLRAPGRTTEERDSTRLRFTEEMKGHVAPGAIEPESGRAAAESAGQHFRVHLTISLDGVRRFMADPEREGSAEGWMEWSNWERRVAVERGTFNLFTDAADPTQKLMHYRLFAHDPAGDPVTLSGHKRVQDDPGRDLWSDTSTLYTRILRGHVSLDEEADGEILGAGIIHVHLLDFLHQLTTFKVEAASDLERVAVLAEFGRFFMGRLWDVYARRVLAYGPI